MTLNSAKTEKVNLKGDDKVLLIVCSTTGNGVRIHMICFLVMYINPALIHDVLNRRYRMLLRMLKLGGELVIIFSFKFLRLVIRIIL